MTKRFALPPRDERPLTLFDSDEPLPNCCKPSTAVFPSLLATQRGAVEAVSFIFTDGSRAVYTDPRRFGIIDSFSAEARTTWPPRPRTV